WPRDWSSDVCSSDLFYGQDQWTTGRLTLQGGMRYDHLLTSYPESRVGGPGYTAAAATPIVYPSRSTQGVKWDDVSPRVGFAYDRSEERRVGKERAER